MSARARQRVARAVNDAAARSAARATNVALGEVLRVKPLTVDLLTRDERIEEGEDLELSQWAELYRKRIKIARGDTVVCVREGGEWVVTDVISDASLAKFGTGDGGAGGGGVGEVTQEEFDAHVAAQPAHGGDLAGTPRPPTAHTHPISDVVSLQAALDAKQALDATLTALAGVATAVDRLPYFNGVDTATWTTLTAFARLLLDDPDASTMRTTLGTDAAGTARPPTAHTHPIADVTNLQTTLDAKQPLDADLTAIAALATTSYGRAFLALADAAAARAAIGAAATTHTHAQADITNLVTDLSNKQPLDSDLTAIAALATTAFGRGLLTLVDASAGRTTLGLVIGTDVQAFDSDLAAIAALATTAFGRALLTMADGAATRAAIGAEQSGLAVLKSLVDAKGDLLVGTANDAVARKAVGTVDGQVLAVDSASADGLAWKSNMRSETVPAVRAKAGSGQAWPHATSTAILFGSEDYDTDGMHSIAANTGRFVCVTPGIYAFDAGVYHSESNGTGAREGWFIKTAAAGGTTTYGDNAQAAHATTGNNAVSASATIKMAVGDYVEFFAYQTSGVALTVGEARLEATWLGGPGNAVDQSGQSAARAYRSAALSIGTSGVSGFVKVPLDALADALDTDGMFDSVNGRLVCKNPGVFELSGAIAYTPAGGTARGCQVKVNGVQKALTMMPSTVGFTRVPAATVPIKLAAGDYVELFGWQDTGANAALNLGSAAEPEVWLAAVRIGSGKQVIPRARVYRNAALSHTASSSWQKVPLDAVSIGMNNDGMFDAANGTLVCKTAGTYVVAGGVMFGASGAGQRLVRFLVAGSPYADQQIEISAAAGNPRGSTVAILDLAVGAVIELQAYQDSGASQAYFVGAGEPCWLSAVKVGQSGPGANNENGWANNGTRIQNTNSGTVDVLTALTLPRVTSLPAGAVDGQIVCYLADAANGVEWMFQYRATEAGPFKWYFIGGNELASVVDASQSLTSAGYADLATVGPSLVIPLAGDYDYTVGADVFVTAANNGQTAIMTPSFGGVLNDVNGVSVYRFVSGGVGLTDVGVDLMKTRRVIGLTAGMSVVAKYRTGSATSTFGERVLRARPVRVG